MQKQKQKFTNPSVVKKLKTMSNDEYKNIEKNDHDKVNSTSETNGKYDKQSTSFEKLKSKKNVKNMKQHAKVAVNASTMKPNWLEFKQKKKELREKYKAKRFNDIHDISFAVKRIGEKLRRSDCSKLERRKLISKAHDLLKTKYDRIILTHDMSRVVQWMLKYCDEELRQAIFKEVKPLFLSMVQSKYAKNCIRVMLKNGSKELRNAIITSCYGNVVRFLSHSVSAPLLERMYSTWATNTQKIHFKQEFYGDMYKRAKDKNVKSLSDVFEAAPGMKTATLCAVKGNLMRILNKKFIGYSVVQTILLEFLNNCTADDRTEMIAMLRTSVVELSQSKIGSKIAVICIWHGTNKDRKIIMKALKENVKTVAMAEAGYFILLALFDTVDDTVLLKKIILSEILSNLTDIALNENGKHVILYLIARRSSLYFPPSIVKYLEQGDNNATSKKPANVKELELLEMISNTLLESVAANPSVWLSKSSVAMVTLAILKAGKDEKLKEAFKSVAEFITNLESRIKDGDDEQEPVEHAGLHMMLKKLIQTDKDLQQRNESTFGEVLINYLIPDVIKKWIACNRGCFLIILLLENEPKPTVNTLVSMLKPMRHSLKSTKNTGAKILLEKFDQIKKSLD